MATRKNQKENENEIKEQEAAVEQAVPAIPDLTVRIFPVQRRQGSKLLANASVNIAGAFAVQGFRIYDSEKGMFVKEPVRQYVTHGTQREQSVFFPVTKEAREKLYGQILDSYRFVMNQDAGQQASEEFEEIDPGEDLPFDEKEEQTPVPDNEYAPVMGM